MQPEEILQIVQIVLDERKGHNITVIDVRGKTSVTDYMVLATGTSDRHLKSLVDYVVAELNEKGYKPLGQEGGLGSDWVLLDLGDVIVHVMTDQARQFYQLEKLWSIEHKAEAVNALQD
ncbi:ribosome silencing factor [Methylicorpusculum sp.]|uniref:ribosome silencing factor n=1 Tax=Methylicorpusculum sp. TaxID=2713644 RepID=UPI00273099AC|nr:ribosome silencing factor [Methylicorpusculum sp.]MDP2180554.1 ribosome silencing factor [Methylicorpusculum sp.]MDP3527714.1 ribosome silencing factor [Methylicorpusculum sp.]MDZ4153384.1 ribosome silencing factor [Methylicorpusculum sp.]